MCLGKLEGVGERGGKEAYILNLTVDVARQRKKQVFLMWSQVEESGKEENNRKERKVRHLPRERDGKQGEKRGGGYSGGGDEDDYKMRKQMG